MSSARAALGIRPVDVGLTAIVIGAVELSVAVGGGPGAAPADALGYVMGAVLCVPVLFRRRWPRFELIACSVLLFAYYSSGHRRNISPAGGRGRPAGGRGTAADRAGPARHGGAQHGHHHRAGRLGPAPAR